VAVDFRDSCKRDALCDFSQFNQDYATHVDLPQRLGQLADLYGRKGDGPGMPFAPMTEEGKAAWPGVNGIIQNTGWARLTNENIDAMFQEVKLRSMLMIAYEQQVEDLYRFTKKIQHERDTLYQWGEVMAKEIQILASMAGNRSDEADVNETVMQELRTTQAQVEDLLAANADKDERITQLQEHATELSMELRTRGRDTPAGSARSHDTTRTDGGTRRSAKLPDPPKFHGDKNKDDLTFEDWYQRVEDKLEGNADHYDSDILKRIYVKSLLAGAAAQDLLPYLDKKNVNYLPTYETLMKHLWNEYHSATARADALELYLQRILLARYLLSSLERNAIEGKSLI
jgi:hypothetical protein